MTDGAPAAGRTRSTPAGASGGTSLLYVGAFVVYGDRFAIAPLLVAIARDFRVSVGATTAVASLYFLLYGLLQIVFGVLSDRVGRVRVLRWSLAGMGLANAISAAAPSLVALAAGKAVTAAFAAAVLPTALVYIGDTVSFTQRQRDIANILAAGALGTVTATVAAGVLADIGAWRVVFGASALVAVALAARIGRLPESLGRLRGGGPVRQLVVVLSNRWARLLVLLAVAEGATMLGFLTFLAPALEAHGSSATVAGLVVASYGAAVFGGMQVLKRSLRRARVPPAALIGIGGTLLVTAYVTAGLDQGVGAVFAASLLIALGYCFLHSTLQTWATEVTPHARGTAVSLFVTGVFTGAAIGTGAVSGLVGQGRYDLVFLIAAAVSVPVVVLASIARARYQPTAEEATARVQ